MALCARGPASIQDDQVEGDDFPPPRARPKGRLGTIRELQRRRIHTPMHTLLGDDALHGHGDE